MEKDKEYWYYFVRYERPGYIDECPNCFKHEVKEEAFRRAQMYLKMRIENYCTDYGMGKPLVGLHEIILKLGYAESLDAGLTYTEEILQEEKLADYLGNHVI